MFRLPVVILVFASALATTLTACGQSYEAQRAALVDQIEQKVIDTSASIGRDPLGDGVIRAMSTVERHEFVPVELRLFSYQDRPLAIGEGQTISQPYIVALMTELADVGPESIVLEVGTGSGYQAAVLAEIVDHVYTIEIVEPLGRRAIETLDRLGYENVTVRIGDGYAGWPERAPFDAILVTAAPEEIPPPLIDQLSSGGRLVIPVGSQEQAQSLQVLEKEPDGRITTRDVLPVVFVPLTRDN